MKDNIPINKRILTQWLSAKTFEFNNIHDSESGVPQGSIISPTISNLVLSGIEETILEIPGTFPIRYADDVIVLSDTKEKLTVAMSHIEKFLLVRGLELNLEKTKVYNITEGYDLLGFFLREYPDPTRVGTKRNPTKKGIFLVKPSKQKIQDFKTTIKSICKRGSKLKSSQLITQLNPVIRGWANYFNVSGG